MTKMTTDPDILKKIAEEKGDFVNNKAVIDPEKCKNCGLCAKDCPTGAILKLPKKKKAVPAAK